MSLTSLALRLAAPLPKPEQFQRYLFIGPHPDDIEIGAGATAAKLAAAGKEICFLVCTDGRFGLTNAPAGTTPEALISIRQEEARRSARMLGVTDLRFLGFSDGGFYDERELVRAIAKVIGDFQPDVIFAPDPDVTSECHRDHLLVGCSAKELATVRNKEIGFVFQSFHLLPKLTALENVALPLLYGGMKKAQRLELARQALETVGLADRAALR